MQSSSCYLAFPVNIERLCDEGLQGAMDICLEIGVLSSIFLGIGAGDDHVRFLIQAMPMCSVTQLVALMWSLSAREIFKKMSSVKSNYEMGGSLCDGLMQCGDEKMVKGSHQGIKVKYVVGYR